MMVIFLYLSKTEAMLYKLEQDLAEEADRERGPEGLLGAGTGNPEEPGGGRPPASDSSASPEQAGLDQPLLAAGDREIQEDQPVDT